MIDINRELNECAVVFFGLGIEYVVKKDFIEQYIDNEYDKEISINSSDEELLAFFHGKQGMVNLLKSYRTYKILLSI